MAFSVSKTGFFEGQKARGVKLPCLPLFDDLTVAPKSAYQDRIFAAVKDFQQAQKRPKAKRPFVRHRETNNFRLLFERRNK